MTMTNTRSEWFKTYQQLTTEAEYLRNSQMVAFGLLDAYDKLAPEDKLEIHEILAEWFVSDDNKLRYSAGFLTSQRQIVEMIPAVEKAVEWIGKPSGPEAKYELQKLNRIRDELKAAEMKDS